MPELHELIDVDEPAWPRVREWIESASKTVEVLPRDRSRAEATILQLQVTTQSVLGAVAWETGGLLVDSGWLRILGSGSDRMADSLATFNGAGAAKECLVVAHDVGGGVFALDGGALGHGRGEAFYFAPESLEWEPCESGYADLLRFLLTDDLDTFYAGARWPGWQRDVSALAADQVFSFSPPRWTDQGKDLSQSSRRPIPFRELFRLELQLARDLSGSQ